MKKIFIIKLVLVSFFYSAIYAPPNQTYMPFYGKLFCDSKQKEAANESTESEKSKTQKKSFFDVFPSAKCEEVDNGYQEFSFDDSRRKKPLYSQEQEIDNLIGRFCRKCKLRDGGNIPQSVFVDIAREMVNSDDESKAMQNYVRFMLFKNPWLGYAGVAAAAFGVGALSHFAFS